MVRMTSSSRYSPQDRALLIDLTVHDHDMKSILDQRVIVAEVRHLIAKRIVDAIMPRLEPAIEKILAECEQRTKEPNDSTQHP
jgi:hypothetical protein